MIAWFLHPGNDRKLDKSRFAKSDSTIKYKKDGKNRFQGNKEKLRETQVYPPDFGRQALRMKWYNIAHVSSVSQCMTPIYHVHVQLYPVLTIYDESSSAPEVCKLFTKTAERPDRPQLVDGSADTWTDARLSHWVMLQHSNSKPWGLGFQRYIYITIARVCIYGYNI